MSAEPELFKGISNTTITAWYYYIFLFNAGISGILLVTCLVLFITNRKLFNRTIGGSMFQIVVSVLLGVTGSLFLYLLSNRALLSDINVNVKVNKDESHLK
jgi:hypothetical protein